MRKCGRVPPKTGFVTWVGCAGGPPHPILATVVRRREVRRAPKGATEPTISLTAIAGGDVTLRPVTLGPRTHPTPPAIPAGDRRCRSRRPIRPGSAESRTQQPIRGRTETARHVDSSRSNSSPSTAQQAFLAAPSSRTLPAALQAWDRVEQLARTLDRWRVAMAWSIAPTKPIERSGACGGGADQWLVTGFWSDHRRARSMRTR